MATKPETPAAPEMPAADSHELFSRLGKPRIGSPKAFSFSVASVSGAGAVTFERGGKTVKEKRAFSVAGGMCPRCEGRGAVSDIDLTQILDEDRSLNDGAVLVPGYKGGGWNARLYGESGFIDPDKPVRKYTKEARSSKIDGISILGLDRATGTLSGGEGQRVKMIRQLGSSLTDVTYVFDEPSIGLHPHDIQRMNDLLLRLRDKGNTVLVVEHKPEMIAIGDHVVDLGPGAGTAGGEVVFEGTVQGLRASGTVTGRHLDDRAALKPETRTPKGALEIRGASRHNLRDVDVDIPLDG